MQRHDTHRSAQPAATATLAAATNEVAELRDEVTALRDEVQRLRAERDGQHLAADAHDVAPVFDGVSRRRLFGLLGGAAVAGAGLAVAGSALGKDRADAVTGNMQFGASNDAGTDVTSLTSTAVSRTLDVANTGTGIGVLASTSANGQSGIQAVANGTNGTGVDARNNNSGHAITGRAPTNSPQLGLIPAVNSPSGPPPTGAKGDFYANDAGELWFCTASGTPGTWVQLSMPLVPVNPPARVLDSRFNGGPLTSSGTRPVTVIGKFGTSPTIPTGISSVLTNLTAVGPNGGGFMAMFQTGTTWSGTSNLNLIAGQDISNNATSAVSAGGQVTVLCGGPVTSVNFIVDVFGYYP